MPSINDIIAANTAKMNELEGVVLNTVNNAVIDASKIRGKTINVSAQNPAGDAILEYSSISGTWEPVSPEILGGKLNLEIPKRITDLDDAPASFAGREGEVFIVSGTGASLIVLESTDLADMPGIVRNSIPVGNSNNKYAAKPYPATFTIVESTTPNFVAKPGESIWFDTSGGTAACFLPNAGVDRGDTILFRGNSLPTNNAFVRRNGQLIDSATADVILNSNNQETLLIWFGGAVGWRSASLAAVSGASPSPSPTPTPGAPTFSYQVIQTLAANAPNFIAIDSSLSRAIYASGASIKTLNVTSGSELATYTAPLPLNQAYPNETGDITYLAGSAFHYVVDPGTGAAAKANYVQISVINSNTGALISAPYLRSIAVGSSYSTRVDNIFRAMIMGVDNTNGLLFITTDGYLPASIGSIGAIPGTVSGTSADAPKILVYDQNVSTLINTTLVPSVSTADRLGYGCINTSTLRYYLPITSQNKVFVFSYASGNGAGTKIGEYTTDAIPLYSALSVSLSRLVVVCSGWVNIFDISSGSPTYQRVSFVGAASGVTILGSEAFVAMASTNNVIVINLTGTPAITRVIPVGTFPSDIMAGTISGVSKVFVANKNSNTISVIG